MSENHEIIQIFVASPSGLDDERRAVWEVVEEINRRNSSNWRLQFKTIGWEDTVGGYRRAQDIINRDLETCDYFFGIMADHWGSPPQPRSDVKNTYTSGFHEEYELAQKLFEAGKMKDILLFFKTIPEDRMRDIGPSLQKVLDFRNKVREDRKPLYTEFEKLEEFKKRVGDALSKIGWEVTTPKESLDIVASSERNTRESGTPLDNEKPIDNKEYFLSSETRDFLSYINEKTGDADAVTNVDVARLRLIASGTHRVGNDEVHVGVHDANLLFLHRADLELSDGERGTLLTASLRYMENQNVPFWYWTGGDANRVKQFIRYRMIIGDESVSGSALKVAAVFGYKIPNFPKSADRGFWIKKWFNDDQANGLYNAAKVYLTRWAEEDDVGALQEIREGKTGTQAAELDCIIINIYLRKSQSDGLKELKERDPEHISSDLQEVLQDMVVGVTTELLHGLAKLKSVYVRLMSIRELTRRKALSQQLAEELSGDNSVDVRLEAIKALSDMAVPIPEERAKAALTIAAASGGLGGLFGARAPTSDSSRFDEYQRYLLKKKSLKELLELEKKDNPFSADALLAAYQNFPRKTTSLLRASLKDGFESRFEDRLRDLENRFTPRTTEFTKSAQDLKRFCCLRQTQAALDILTMQLKREDLPLVREVIDRWGIEASNEVLSYFLRFGDWEDVERILKLKEKVDGRYTVLGTGQRRHDKLVGRALFGVGGVRIVDLLARIESHTIKAGVIGACTQKGILRLGDEMVLELMNDNDDQVRKVAALRCLEAFPKARLGKLLDVYVDRDEYRYYNVIHWLDLGVTMPRQFVRKIVRSELKDA